MKLIYNKSTKLFSVKIFSDWDQIRDLVKSSHPKINFEKVRGSDDGKSYKVKMTSNGRDQIIEVPINGKSALDNFIKASGMEVENTSKPKIRPSIIAKTKGPKLPKNVLKAVGRSDDPVLAYEEILTGNSYPSYGELPKDLYDAATKNILSGNVESSHVIAMWLSNENTKTEDLESCMEKYYPKYKNAGDQFLNRVLTNPNVSDKIIKMMVSDPPDVAGIPDQLCRYLISNNDKLPKDILDKCSQNKELKYTTLGNKSLNKSTALNLFKDADKSSKKVAAASLLSRDDLTEEELKEISRDAISSNMYRPEDLYKVLNLDPRGLDLVPRHRFHELVSDDNISYNLRFRMAARMDPTDVMNTKLDPGIKFDIYGPKYEKVINGLNPKQVDTDWNLINTIHYLNDQLDSGTSTVSSKDLKSIYMSLRNLNVDPNKLVDSVWTKIVNAYNSGDAISNVIPEGLKLK